MKVTCFGNASIKIEAEGRTIFIDPYMKKYARSYEPAALVRRRQKEFLHAEDILITHGHIDHMGSVAALFEYKKRKRAKRSETAEESGAAEKAGIPSLTVYCTKTPAGKLVSQGVAGQCIRVISPGQILAIGDVRIHVFRSGHVKFDAGEIAGVVFRHRLFTRLGRFFSVMSEHASYKANGECLLFDISAEGKRIQVIGSAGILEDENYETGADALVLPFQGRSDMVACCMEIVKRLRPKAVLVDHFDDAFPPLTTYENPSRLVRAMAKKMPGVSCKPLYEGRTVVI